MYNCGMNRTVTAIFDAGVFRPLQPVDLAPGTQVEVQVPIKGDQAATDELSAEELARQRQAIEEMIARIESLPPEGPDDGFSGQDHDKILYRRP